MRETGVRSVHPGGFGARLPIASHCMKLNYETHSELRVLRWISEWCRLGPQCG